MSTPDETAIHHRGGIDHAIVSRQTSKKYQKTSSCSAFPRLFHAFFTPFPAQVTAAT
jgi:hypothetical protein